LVPPDDESKSMNFTLQKTLADFQKNLGGASVWQTRWSSGEQQLQLLPARPARFITWRTWLDIFRYRNILVWQTSRWRAA
jgi:hypothetical protein